MVEIARNHGVRPTKRKEIAESQGITEAYLENILTVLRASQFLKAIRGADGGFVLLKDPASITLYDIVEVLDPNFAPVSCVTAPDECQRHATCPSRPAWVELFQAQKKVLTSITLRDLVDRDQSGDMLNYSI